MRRKDVIVGRLKRWRLMCIGEVGDGHNHRSRECRTPVRRRCKRCCGCKRYHYSLTVVNDRMSIETPALSWSYDTDVFHRLSTVQGSCEGVALALAARQEDASRWRRCCNLKGSNRVVCCVDVVYNCVAKCSLEDMAAGFVHFKTFAYNICKTPLNSQPTVSASPSSLSVTHPLLREEI